MSVVEIIILIIGATLVVSGYSYGKISESKKGKKVPAGYTECIGICKKHEEKDGRFFEVFEVIHDGKTIKYKFPPQESKDNLRKIDSIEKFYIDKSSGAKAVKTLSDIVGSDGRIDKKTLYACYALMGAGLIIILIILMRVIF
ncbi:hypothetical protein IJV57_04890 [Candidatus Saccharibacteria bacterium]|nr:hypothetical protein [Candidatus Saccharibacteria bacterium]